MKIHGYTTLMVPEAMGLPYLETIMSWAQICDTINICFSTVDELPYGIPDGAICPWKDDGSRAILEKFDKEVLGGKLNFVDHKWELDNPGEDGVTKQAARALAIEQCKGGPIEGDWVAHFDADEVLNHDDGPKLLNLLDEDNSRDAPVRRPYLLTGILEMFGNMNQVRFGFGNWLKIRMTRPFKEIQHGSPMFIAQGLPCRTRNEAGRLVSRENRDDFAGFISTLNYERPDYNSGIWAADPDLFNAIFSLRRTKPGGPDWIQTALRLQADLLTGVWLFHTSWIDIPRKWRMGWWFDNFWSVLSGKQTTFTEKAELSGNFTHTRAPQGEELEKELAVELARPEIRPVGDIVVPMYFDTVRQWRQANNLPCDIPGIPYEE